MMFRLISLVLCFGAAGAALEQCKEGYVDKDYDTSAYTGNITKKQNEMMNKLPGSVEMFQTWGGRENGEEPLRSLLKDGGAMDPSKGPMKEYVEGLAPLAAPGIALFVITFLFGLFMMLARWCCAKCCCKPKKPFDQYSRCEQYWPLIALLLSAVIAAIFAILGIVNLEDVKKGTGDVVCSMDSMAGDLSASFKGFYEPIIDTLDGMADGRDELKAFWVDNEDWDFSTLSGYLEIKNAAATVDYSIERLQKAVNPDDPVGVGNGQLYTLVGEASSQTDGGAHSLCPGYGDRTSVFEIEQVGTTVPVLSAFKVVGDAMAEVVTQVTVTLALGEAGKAVLGTIYNYTSVDFPEAVESMDESTRPGMEKWQKVSVAFFGFVFFSVAVAIVCFVAFLTPCKFDDKIAHVMLHCSWFFSWAFGMVLFLLCGIGIPTAVLLSDTCVILKEIPDDVNGYFGPILGCNATLNETDACGILDSCFNGGSYIEVLFSDVEIVFPEVPEYPEESAVTILKEWDIHIAKDLAEMKTCIDAILATPASTNVLAKSFWMEGQPGEELIDAIDNYQTLFPPLFATFEKMEAASDRSVEIPDEIKGKWDELMDNKESCDVIGGHYDDIMNHLCTTALGGYAAATMWMFLVGVMGFPQIVLSVYVSIHAFGSGQRKGGKGGQTVAPLTEI